MRGFSTISQTKKVKEKKEGKRINNSVHKDQLFIFGWQKIVAEYRIMEAIALCYEKMIPFVYVQLKPSAGWLSFSIPLLLRKIFTVNLYFS